MSFTPNKNIETPAHNADINTWDVNANANFTLIDTCFSGTLLLNATGLSGTQALTQAQVQPPTIQISGAPTAAITYTVPTAIGGVWVVRNTTSGGFLVGMASAAGGSTVFISAGQAVHMWCDGTATGMVVVNAPPTVASAFTGMVVPFAGTIAPGGTLLCNGQAVSRATFANLFTVIGTVYGSGDGSTTFNVPDLRGRVIAGMDVMGGSTNANRLSSVMSSTTLGATGGSANTSTNITVTGSNTTDADNLDIVVQAGSGQTVADAGHQHTFVVTSNSVNTFPVVQPTMVMNQIIFT